MMRAIDPDAAIVRDAADHLARTRRCTKLNHRRHKRRFWVCNPAGADPGGMFCFEEAQRGRGDWFLHYGPDGPAPLEITA